MRERQIHALIEQQDPEGKQRIWEKISAQIDDMKQINLFTYVNNGNGYVKKPITLFELITRLSDKTSGFAQLEQEKNHPRG